MFTRTRPAEPHESFGLSEEQHTDETTIIEVYLKEVDLDFARENHLLVLEDPTVEDGIIVASPTSLKDNGLDIDCEGNVTATPAFGDNQISRIWSENTPIEYSTAHQDGKGDSSRGTVIQFYHESEA